MALCIPCNGIKCTWTCGTSNPITVHVRHPDIDRSGAVAIIDLALVLTLWGGDDADVDLNNDGLVGILDLAAVLTNWGL